MAEIRSPGCRTAEPLLITEMGSGRIMSANDSALALLGMDAASLIGRTTIDVGIWLDSGQRNSFLACLAIEGSIVRYPVRFIGAEGRMIEAFISAEPCDSEFGLLLFNRIVDDSVPADPRERPDRVLSFLSRAATKFLVDEGADFYRLVVCELRALVPNSLVVVSVYDPASSSLVVKDHSAPDRIGSAGPVAPLRFEAVESAAVDERMLKSLLRGELFELPIDRAENGPRLSKALADLDVRNHLLIGLSWHGTVFGAVSILVRTPDAVPDRDAVETFVRQASVALQRNERSRALMDSLKEKETLLREIHHRVKNNLQIVASLLKLQGGAVTDAASLTVLAEAADRVQSMALVHTMLYDNRNLSSIDAAEFLRALVTQIIRGGRFDASSVRVEYDLQSMRLDPDHAVPVGLIVNELVTNSLKYGMDGSSPFTLSLSFKQEGSGRELVVADSGGVLPADFSPASAKTLGMQLVSSLTRQLRGRLAFSAGARTVFRVQFPM